MTWRVFREEPGELPRDDALLAYVDAHLDLGATEYDAVQWLGLVEWQAGRVNLEDPLVWRIVEWAWQHANDAGGDGDDPRFVMARVADLVVRRVIATQT